MATDERRGPEARRPEWPEALDVRALLEAGWRPTPFREFVIKVHSRCNLACDYCYMYEMADQGWRRQPRRMSRPIVDMVARRIAEHARANLLPKVDVVLHGGEPLLAGVEHLRYVATTLREAMPDVEVALSVQTNGVLLDPFFLDLFDELDICVGVSMDGDEEAHDLHRRRADGRGSYQAVRAGLAALTSPRYRRLFGGLLSTIDLRNDPVRTYEALLDFDPPAVDFLLPHGNWDAPPPGRPRDRSTPYGDWLIKVFDRWYGAEVRETRIRLFTSVLRLLLGLRVTHETVGLGPISVVVVETNGQIEQVDSLKSAFEGATGTPLHVSRDPFDSALMLPPIVARQIGPRALASACRECAVHRVCGGGHYVHRYRSGSGFLNPSVYCEDLYRLITHIHDVLSRDVRALQPGT
ncbi:radical SAM protein [Actinomadura sp. NBRC 104412]|uniref:FxsB family cyclophane-forming radical SAM/SPASM peptide maturase n=1 Tax=Actinomadura sp. NBRC 104412 TaxID=3032203 RepID=UPI0024A1DFF1|nr:FxsB family cyclophane-forming radical SAM/SPASM peptide maturase [Actinomadura sp. NBRC 104412]GLZ08570.1 radical SAM protein [Actinomadura sp. NBRC 104412]